MYARIIPNKKLYIYLITISTIFISGILFLSIWKKKFNTYIRDLLDLIMDLIWIPIMYLIIEGINAAYDFSKLLGGLNRNKNSICIIIFLFVFFELLIKYRKTKEKYLEVIISYLKIGVGVIIVLGLLINDQKSISINILLIIQCINIEMAIKYSKGITQNNNRNVMYEATCQMYEELFESRKVQANNIISYIDSYSDKERFTLLLNGEWGTGKTSIIKGIQSKCKDKYDMIFIQPMLFDKKELLVEYFCERLKEILSKKNIYVGSGSSVEKYLSSLIEWVSQKSKYSFGTFLKSENKSDFRVIKQELQNDIYKYIDKNKIIVIVDDFDRVDSDTIKEILMFIREVIDFEGIDIILLMNYSRILSEEITDKYLDKYIDRRIDLVKIELREVINHYIKCCIKEEFKEPKDKILLMSELIKILDIDTYITRFNDLLYAPANKIEKELIDPNNANVREKIEEKQRKYQEIIDKFKNLKDNIRLIKKITKEFVVTCKNLQTFNDKTFTLDDIEIICKFITIKNMFFEEYGCMQKEKSIRDYFGQVYYAINAERLCIESILKEVAQNHIITVDSINKCKILDAILTGNFNCISFESRTEQQKLLDKIDLAEELIEIKSEIIPNTIESEDDFKESISEVYNAIFIDFFDGCDIKIVRSRLKKVNEFTCKLVEKYNICQFHALLLVGLQNTSIQERFNLNYIFLKDLYYYAKNESEIVTKPIQIKLIRNAIMSIRQDNINSVLKIINILLELIQVDDMIKAEGIFNLDALNYYLKKVFNIKNKLIYKDSIAQVEQIMKELNNKIMLLDKSRNINKNYIHMSLTRFILIEKLLVRLESVISNKIDLLKVYEGNLKEHFGNFMEYNDFYRDCLKILKSMLSSTKILNHNDILVIYAIIDKTNMFKKFKKYKKYDVSDIVLLLNSVIRKISVNLFPHDYDYIETQRLALYMESTFKEEK